MLAELVHHRSAGSSQVTPSDSRRIPRHATYGHDDVYDSPVALKWVRSVATLAEFVRQTALADPGLAGDLDRLDPTRPGSVQRRHASVASSSERPTSG